MILEFHNRCQNSQFEKAEAFVSRALELTETELTKRGVGGDLSKKTLVLVAVDESEGQKLNFEFRQKDQPTDVLSFSPVEDSSVGELVFCWPLVERQATEHGFSTELELAHLALHGLLHLLGFEHEQGGEAAQKMFALQDEIFFDIQGLES